MTTTTDTAYDAALAYATAEGTRAGIAAASWYELPDGSRSRYDAAVLRAIIDGVAEGDPAVLDTLPYADLSGEWAGTLTGPQLVRDALAAAGEPDVLSDGEPSEAVFDWSDAICDAYETAFSTAASDEIVRRATYQLDA